MMTITDKGRNLFDLLSVLPADPLDGCESERLSRWIESGRSGALDYMRRPVDRADLRTLMPDVRTVVVAARFYDRIQAVAGVARFAQGGDYHVEIKDRLYTLLASIREDFPSVKGRAVVDTAPAFEKAWARRAGFGWAGRNSIVINPLRGSFFNIGLLLLDKEFPEQSSPPVPDGCAGCRICIDACPMHAIGEDRMIDAGRCISALTVERMRRGGKAEPVLGWTWGCDECQICCPFNDFV